MTMTPGLRKFMLTVHIIVSVGFLGSVASFIALAIVGLTGQDPQIVRAVYIAMDYLTRMVIVPLCVAALVTGIIQSLGTPWGLFLHFWVLVKLLLTLFTTLVLLLQLEGIRFVAGLAAEAALTPADYRGLRLSFVWPHAIGGLLVLVLIIALSIYKPRGLTWYGWRKKFQQSRGP